MQSTRALLCLNYIRKYFHYSAHWYLTSYSSSNIARINSLEIILCAHVLCSRYGLELKQQTHCAQGTGAIIALYLHNAMLCFISYFAQKQINFRENMNKTACNVLYFMCIQCFASLGFLLEPAIQVILQSQRPTNTLRACYALFAQFLHALCFIQNFIYFTLLTQNSNKPIRYSLPGK